MKNRPHNYLGGDAVKAHWLHSTWMSMKNRCHYATSKDYPTYGGKGIKMPEMWVKDARAFYGYIERQLGPKPTPAHTLDRIDNTKGYHEGNLRWATQREQCNNKSNNRRIKAFGQDLTVAQWARRLGTNRSTIRYRLEAGWSDEQAVSITPNHANKVAK